MKKNLLFKLILCSAFVILLSSFYMSSSYALGNVFSQGKDFLMEGNSISEKIDTTQLQETSNAIYNTLLAIGIMIAIIIAMILGIQFIVASADEKAKVKEALIPFVVGCVVVFGSFTIWKLVVTVGNDTENAIAHKTANDSLNDKFSIANYEFRNCMGCGKILTEDEQKNDKCSCGDLVMFADRTATYCGFCGSDNVVWVATKKDEYVYQRKHSKSGADLYCYNCDLWNNSSSSEEKEIRLVDVTSEAKDIVEEERNKVPSERNGNRG